MAEPAHEKRCWPLAGPITPDKRFGRGCRGWALRRADRDVGGACLFPTLRAVSLVAGTGTGPLRPEDVLARCPQQVKAQNKRRTWIPLAVGLQKSWLWPVAAGRRVSVGDAPLSPQGPWGSLPLPFPVGAEKPRTSLSPSAAPA